MSSAAQRFISLIFDGRYDEADAVLREQRDPASVGDTPRLIGVGEALRTKILQLGFAPSAQRRILAGTYMSACQLREQKYWCDAAAIYLDVVELSLTIDEAFFLNDARLSRAVCLKNLGRITEYEREKAKVPADTTILIDGVNWRVEDL
ncbi:hypothetical protein [Bradyrhizobium symbiodeficiens]|uniref:Uncharacterized protein n=1 Tax=Bradyrhizobium symbiodeficiens TaxID=1404367 RepID=A0A6G9A899_9BRAD|nr:hypothetical protein [Bradyrhizobium symbiodeficiens]QIP08539.1 hypothetical protein HAV00_20765 [Bradyrhizobium symbiodeficiens]